LPPLHENLILDAKNYNLNDDNYDFDNLNVAEGIEEEEEKVSEDTEVKKRTSRRNKNQEELQRKKSV